MQRQAETSVFNVYPGLKSRVSKISPLPGLSATLRKKPWGAGMYSAEAAWFLHRSEQHTIRKKNTGIITTSTSCSFWEKDVAIATGRKPSQTIVLTSLPTSVLPRIEVRGILSINEMTGDFPISRWQHRAVGYPENSFFVHRHSSRKFYSCHAIVGCTPHFTSIIFPVRTPPFSSSRR